MHFQLVELKNRINAFFKRLMQFGYINCVITIDDLINSTDYELFNKVCSASHSISSHRIGQVIFVSEVILFSCLITVLICIKNPLLFGPCISISNKVILVFSCIALCFYCFYVFSMFHFYCIVMYIDVHLSHPNKDYLLFYAEILVPWRFLAETALSK